MPKERMVRTTITLPEWQLQQIDIANPNHSEEIRKALRAWFGRDPTPTELFLSEEVAQRAAAARARREEAPQ